MSGIELACQPIQLAGAPGNAAMRAPPPSNDLSRLLASLLPPSRAEFFGAVHPPPATTIEVGKSYTRAFLEKAGATLNGENTGRVGGYRIIYAQVPEDSSQVVISQIYPFARGEGSGNEAFSFFDRSGGVYDPASKFDGAPNLPSLSWRKKVSNR
ncbi:hypothetical protein HYU13_02190 [Candidatus Woesearchaeota archaeon]|nr:hypothetical protein [Candidatus Woesearchaeota archaeon]